MADLREDFVQYIVKTLVSNPDAVVLNRAHDEKGDYLELTVDPSDMGKVIGKAGATAKSIRTLLRGVGAKDDLPPLPLKIIDPEGSPRVEAPAAEAPAAEAEAPTEEAPTEVPVEASAEEAPAEPVAEPDAAPEPDDHQQLHDDTKREMQELADFEV